MLPAAVRGNRKVSNLIDGRRFLYVLLVLHGMVFLVPYDGSRVARIALDRAVSHGEALETDVVAVSFVPTGAEYAERRKWIDPSENFAAESAQSTLERKIEESTDDAERLFSETVASAPTDGVADQIKQVADDVDASVLYVGTSESDEEELMTPFGTISPDGAYDVHLVRSY